MKLKLPWRIAVLCLLLSLTLAAVAVTNSHPDTNFIDPALTLDNPAAAQLNELMAKAKADSNSSGLLDGGGGFDMSKMLDAHFLFASLIWGTVGGGYLLYARKQREIPPFLGGVAMIVISIAITSWFWMSVASIAIMVGVYLLMRNAD